MNIRKGMPLSILFSLFIIPFLFQNCAPQNSQNAEYSSTARVKLPSPFENKKVLIDYKSLSLKANSNGLSKNSIVTEKLIPANSHLVVNINNQCAVGFCENDKNADSQTCKLFKKYNDSRLKNYSQAYVYVTEKVLTEKEFENLFFSHKVDSYCVVGVSQRETYKIEFNSASAEFLSSYHHQILKTDQAYDFFRDEFFRTGETSAKSQVRIGIVDTGVEFSHSEFSASTRGKSMNFSAACPTSICNFHGTFVAGIIAAQLSGNQGSFGIAPNAVIYSYQVGDKAGSIASEELINAVKQAVIDDVEILNLSLGSNTGLDASYQAALVDAINKNILIVAAAGNSNSNLDLYPSYPPSFGFDGIISVGAASPSLIAPMQQGPPSVEQISSTIRKDTFSNYSSSLIGIAAPGTAIFSTTINGSFGAASGTSFSAPMVTGAMALARGYLKVKNFSQAQITPTLLKSILYDSAEILPSLSEKVNGTDVTYFTNNRFLNLAKLKNYLIDYVGRINSSPARIELSSFEVIKNLSGGNVGKFRVEVKDADPTLGLSMRVYTNRAFKDESEVVTAQCQIDLARKFCEFTLPYTNMLVDPEVYFEITDTNGVVISSLNILKENLDFGVKEDADVAGEIASVSLMSGRPVVEGWACLIGFPDKLEIEVRKDDPLTGPVVKTIKPNQQARGNYFSLCDSAEITFGFMWTVPGIDKYYFVAKHPTLPAKNRVLKAYSYFPKYQDSLPAQFIDYIQIDKNWSSLTPVNPRIDVSNFTYDGSAVHIAGSVCYDGIYKPSIISFNFAPRDITNVFGDPRNHSLTSSIAETSSTKTYGWQSASQTFVNPRHVDRSLEKDNLGHVGLVGPFSELADEFTLSGSAILSEPEKNVLIPNRNWLYGTAMSQYPVSSNGSPCLVPSAFNINFDISKNIQMLQANASIFYRSDLISVEQIFSANPNAKKFVEVTSQDQDFAELNFNKMSLFFRLIANYGDSYFYDPPTRYDYEYSYPYPYSSSFGYFELVKLDSLISPSHSSTLTLSQIKSDPPPELKPMASYFQVLPLNLSVSSESTSLEKIWESDWINLSHPSKSSLVIFPFDTGVKFGNIDKDFKLEVLEEDELTITKAEFDILSRDLPPVARGNMFSYIYTKNRNAKIKIRLFSNKKNQLKLKPFGIVTL